MSNSTPLPAADLATSWRFIEMMFGHESLRGLKIGVSRFPPERGAHSWHDTPEDAAAEVVRRADSCNVYFRTTPVREPPPKGRGKADLASAILGVHGDIDFADPVHKKTNLPPDRAAAMAIVERIGLRPTILVDSGHGLQPHYLLGEPTAFTDHGEWEIAVDRAARFQQTIAAAADSLGGWQLDSVGDLARVLRVPGTLNLKADPRSVSVLDWDGPRYVIEDIESVLIDPQVTGNAESDVAEEAGGTSITLPSEESEGHVGFSGTDEELFGVLRRFKHKSRFIALHDNGDLLEYGGDASRGDWHLVDILAFWCGPNVERIDRIFRRSKLMRPKWDEVHSGDGKTYGQMTIDDVLSKRKVFFKPKPRLPSIVVSGRQLRDQTADALAALQAVNNTPRIFQHGRDIVRVCVDQVTGNSMICRVGVDEMTGILTRCADFLVYADDTPVGVAPPKNLARDILSLPTWAFPALAGLVERPRLRPDGSVLCKPGYDAATKLWLAEYAGSESFSVPDDPSNDDVAWSTALIDDLFCDFPFVGDADRANAYALLLTTPLRSAIQGCVPVAGVEAKSKQGTGKGLLVKCTTIPATGRIPMMTAIPDDEAEWRKSLAGLVETGREIVVFDNATSLFIESGYWANVITAEVFDERLLGTNKRIMAPVRQVWAITGNGMAFGGDMVRRVFQIMLDARVERPEDRTEFKHELPAWAVENSLDLLRAVLILARRWWSDGCPRPRVDPWGSFEEWTRIVGGVLEHAGVNSFLDNRRVFREAADTERGEWFAFVSAIAGRLAEGRPFTSAALADVLKNDASLRDSLPDRLREHFDKEKGFTTRLGTALFKHEGAIFGEYRLERAGKDTHGKKTLYRVVAAKPAGSAGSCV